MNLLNDQNTDISTSINNINKNIGIFYKSYRNYLKQNKLWSVLINYHPTILTIYGTLITHKNNIPLRQLITDINTAPITLQNTSPKYQHLYSVQLALHI